VLRGLVAAALLILLVPALAQGAKAPGVYNPDFQTFALAGGEHAGTVFSSGALKLGASGLSSFTYTDPHGTGSGSGSYDAGTWTGPWRDPSSPFIQAVASWIASTPAGTWVQVEFRARAGDGHLTKWYVLGRWAYGDAEFHRTSLSGQGDKDGYVAIDTFVPKNPMSSYQLRLTLYRAVGTSATPRVARIGAVISDPVTIKPYAPSNTTMSSTVELAVPAYSQETHRGEYPQYDNGGEAWCSPTSTSMVVAYWGKGPSAADYAFVKKDYPAQPDPWVDYAARYVFDYHYNGAGNWPFNTAYAAHFGLESEVTQLHSLAEAEQFIKAGIPLVASIAFNSGKLDGFFFKSTNGHLMVIVGFTAEGNPIVNDPASPDDASVRHVYDRTQFEDAWMSASGGIVYVIHPASVPLPASPAGNW
jgi:hypothetical protein